MRAKTIQDTINESIQYDDDNLNAAELRSLASGKNVLKKGQMAACYLNAKNAAGRSEDNKTNFAGRMARKMNKNEKETDFQRVTTPRLADMLDLSWRTVSYTVSKFRLLLDGNREGTLSNVMYEKILYYFDLFEKMQPSQVMAIAMEAVDPDADYTQSEEAAESSAKYSKISQEKKKASDKLKVDMINNLTNTFVQYKPLGEEKAAMQALKSISTKYNISISELIQSIKSSKIEPSLRRIFLSYAGALNESVDTSLLKDIHDYIFLEESEVCLHDEFIERVVTVMGPILLAAGLIEEDDLQYWHDTIDWGATINDLVVFLSTNEKKIWMKAIEKGIA